MLLKHLFEFYYFGLSLKFRWNKSLTFEGPIRGDQLSDEDYSKILDLRKFRYKKSVPHLFDENSNIVDQAMTTYHFMLKDRAQNLLASVRFVEFPFWSISSLIPKEQLARYYDYLEISRLVVCEDHKKYAIEILSYAGLMFIRQNKHHGFLAQCSLNRSRIFTQMGMLPIDSTQNIFNYQGREYNILVGSFSQITHTFINHLYQKVVQQLTSKGISVWKRKV